MSTPIAIEVNCATGEVVERELTQAEQDQRAADAAAAATAEAERVAAEEARQAARAAAVQRFKALGFTDEEIATLVLP